MPLPMVPAPMTTTALSVDSAVALEWVGSTIDGLRGLKRGTGPDLGKPLRQPRRDRAPAEPVEPVVEVPERTCDRDVADGERRLGECLRLVVEQREGGPRLELEGIDQRLQRRLSLALVAPEDQRVQQAVAQRVPSQRLPFVGSLLGEERARGEVVEVFADDDRVEER